MVRSWSLALLSCILLSLALPGCTKEAPAQRESLTAPSSSGTSTASTPAIVFLGDSLTAGRGLAESEAVPALIQREVEASNLNYRVINGGRSGDTTAGGLSRLDWYLRSQVNLGVLVIGLGSNDAMRGLSLSSIEENLRQIIEKTRAALPDTRILLWELRTFPNMGAHYGDEYRQVFRRVAQEMNVKLIPFPLEPVAGNPALNQDDNVHPNAAGTRLVAKHIWAHLSPEL